MYHYFISTVAVLIAALSLAVELNLLQPVQPVEETAWSSLLYQVKADQ